MRQLKHFPKALLPLFCLLSFDINSFPFEQLLMFVFLYSLCSLYMKMLLFLNYFYTHVHNVCSKCQCIFACACNNARFNTWVYEESVIHPNTFTYIFENICVLRQMDCYNGIKTVLNTFFISFLCNILGRFVISCIAPTSMGICISDLRPNCFNISSQFYLRNYC